MTTRKIDYLAVYFIYAARICWTQNDNKKFVTVMKIIFPFEYFMFG